ncbi:MAG: hypothetical protein AAFY85_10175 [Pseudomonadota bacterium]
MTDTAQTPDVADHIDAPMSDEDLDAALEAMRTAEEGETPGAGEGMADQGTDETGGQDTAIRDAGTPGDTPGSQARDGGEKTGEKAGEQGGDDRDTGKPPLSREEVESRWTNTKTALFQERSKRREADSEIAALRARLEALEGKSAAPDAGQNEAGQKDGEDAGPGGDIPDPDEDPDGAFRAAIRFAKAKMAEEREATTQAKQQAANQEQMTTLLNAFQAAEADYRQAVPDYDDAAAFFAQSRLRELAARGMAEDQARRAVIAESAMITRRAVEGNQHPADMIYRIAEARGYQKKAPPAHGQAQSQGQGQGQGQGTPNAAAMDRREKAGQLSQTLSGSGGRAATSNGVTIELLNETQSGDDFDRLFEEMRRAETGV